MYKDIKICCQPCFDNFKTDIKMNITRTPVKGRSGNKYYTDLSLKVWDQFFYDSVDLPTYIVAQVDGNTLTLKAFKQNGTLVDSYFINKATGLDTPATVLPARYANTQVVVYGNEAKDSASNPINAIELESNWYIPLNFVTVQYGKDSNLGVTGYNYDDESEQITFTMGTKTYLFTVGSTIIVGVTTTLINPIILQNRIPMIEVNDIKAVWGFTYKYDAIFNMLLLAK